MKNLKIAAATYNDARFIPQSCMGYTANLAFDCGAKTYRFGTGLDEAEAQAIVDALQQRWPQIGTNKHARVKFHGRASPPSSDHGAIGGILINF